MDDPQAQLAGAAIFFLVIFVSGFRLRRSGKPYGVLLFNLHKLVALAAAVLLVITLYRVNQADGASALALTLGIVASLLFLSSIVTGGLVSLEKAMPAPLLLAHRLLPYLILLSTAAALYLLQANP